MRVLIKTVVCLFIIIGCFSMNAYASVSGGPHLWLSTDPNNFDAGGIGYIGSAPGWQDESYIAKSMPLTMYLYNAAPTNKGTADNIGLIVVAHTGDTSGSITIADAFGMETTLKYSDFTANDPYPGGNHGVYNSDGVYAILRPGSDIDLTTDKNGHENTTSDSSSWTKFIVKSSSFSEVHFDAIGGDGYGEFYNPGSHDVDLFGVETQHAPEPVSIGFFGFGLAGLTRLLHKKKRGVR